MLLLQPAVRACVRAWGADFWLGLPGWEGPRCWRGDRARHAEMRDDDGLIVRGRPATTCTQPRLDVTRSRRLYAAPGSPRRGRLSSPHFNEIRTWTWASEDQPVARCRRVPPSSRLASVSRRSAAVWYLLPAPYVVSFVRRCELNVDEVSLTRTSSSRFLDVQDSTAWNKKKT